MEFDVTVITLAAGNVSLFLAGWFLGRRRPGHSPQPGGGAASAFPSASAALPAVPPADEAIQKELEIARGELRQKDQAIEELRANTNRLGQRILEVEAELHAKEEELREVRAQNSPQELLESMDPFVDALQKESDQLRMELENAYRLINRQELELSRLRSSSVDFQPEETELQMKVQKLEEQIALLQGKCSQYEAMLLEAGTPPEASMADSQSFVPPLLRDPPPERRDSPAGIPGSIPPETTKTY